MLLFCQVATFLGLEYLMYAYMRTLSDKFRPLLLSVHTSGSLSCMLLE